MKKYILISSIILFVLLMKGTLFVFSLSSNAWRHFDNHLLLKMRSEGGCLSKRADFQTNGLYDIELKLNEQWEYVSEKSSGMYCKLAILITLNPHLTSSCDVRVSNFTEKSGLFVNYPKGGEETFFSLSKDFMNASFSGTLRESIDEKVFSVLSALGRKQPTDAGYLYLFVFPPYSGFTSEDTVALFKSPETFPYDEFDGVLIRARLNLMGNADQ